MLSSHSLACARRMTLPLVVVTAASSMTSCRKSLCYDHYRSLYVDFVWEQVWERQLDSDSINNVALQLGEARYRSLIPSICDEVTAITCNVETPQDFRMSYHDNSGADLAIDGGANLLMFFNQDTEDIIFDDLDNVYAAIATSRPLSRSTYVPAEGEVTMTEPDVLYGAFIPDMLPIEVHQHHRITVEMTPLVFTYVIFFGFDSGIEHVAGARGALTGMARGVYLHSGDRTIETATVFFDNCAASSHGIDATTRSFGTPTFYDRDFNGDESIAFGKVDSAHTLVLEVMLSAGSIKTFAFDVTQQVAAQPAGGIISVSGIVIDDNDNTGGGLDIDLDGWGNVIDTVLDPKPV